jgi:hypothetical protein
MAVGIRHADHMAPSIGKVGTNLLTSQTSGCRSVGIVSSHTQATEFSFFKRLTDGGEVVSLTCRLLFISPPSRKIPGTCLCARLSKTQGHSATERKDYVNLKQSNVLIRNRTRDLPALCFEWMSRISARLVFCFLISSLCTAEQSCKFS